MLKFDPNKAATQDSGIFGLPYSEQEASLVFLPVPWEATTSYGGGTSQGPTAILNASRQVDLYDLDVLRPYEAGLYLLPESEQIISWNRQAKAAAQRIIKIHSGASPDLHSEEKGEAEAGEKSFLRDLKTVNELGELMNQSVYTETKRLLKAGKIVGVLGGDHSVPFGALKAIAEKYPTYGILHLDAHSDTREAYEGFTWSHASIMYNVLEKIPAVQRLVQVGIRDLCEEEFERVLAASERVKMFYDRDLQFRKFEGESWGQLCREIVAALPEAVWVSFDIDGLDPRFCPHTGTPVPGGLDFQEVLFLLSMLVASGKKIIGFDLNEVAPNLEDPSDEWDANVAARLLYKLSAWTLLSQGKVKSVSK